MELDFKAAVAENVANDPGTPYRLILSSESVTPEEKEAARAKLVELSKTDVWWSIRKKFFGDLYTDAEALENYISGKGFWDASERADARYKARLEAQSPEKPASMPEPESSAPEQTATVEKLSAPADIDPLDAYLSTPTIVSVRQADALEKVDRGLQQGFQNHDITPEQHAATVHELLKSIDALAPDSNPRLEQFQREKENTGPQEKRPLNHMDAKEALAVLEEQERQRIAQIAAERDRREQVKREREQRDNLS